AQEPSDPSPPSGAKRLSSPALAADDDFDIPRMAASKSSISEMAGFMFTESDAAFMATSAPAMAVMPTAALVAPDRPFHASAAASLTPIKPPLTAPRVWLSPPIAPFIWAAPCTPKLYASHARVILPIASLPYMPQ